MTEEVEYESDPEEAKLSLKMRRRVASDDEDESEERREKSPRRIDSDVESDGQGAPADYDDELQDEEEEYLEEEELLEEGYYEEEGEGEGWHRGQELEAVVAVEGNRGEEGGGDKLVAESTEADGRGTNGLADNSSSVDNQQQEGEEEEKKKENEPYAVPTAGAFYMHDDRFRDNAGGRHRRTLGGRRLWESKDDRKWGHDKFEELTIQERQYEEGRRSSRGRFRGRGRSRGALRGDLRGNRPKTYGDDNNQVAKNSQNNAPKSVRGRGPRRYQQSFKNRNDPPPTQDKQSGKAHSSGRTTVPTSSLESTSVPAKKQVLGSNLNYDSPPFYPASSSNKEITLTQKRDVQAGMVNRNVQPPVVDDSFHMAQSNSMRGKNIVDSIGMDKLHIDDSSSAGKFAMTLPFALSGSVSSSQSQPLRAQGGGLSSLPQMHYQPTANSDLVNRATPPTQLHMGQRNSVQSEDQPSMQVSGQQFARRPGSLSQGSSAPKAAMPVNFLESGELESPSDSSKSKTGLVGKAKVNVHGSGRGSFLYGGTQVMGPSGNMNTSQGDKNFPAFLPVMQFGGQHPGGIGVPAVGMAFPGYVGNPQLGLGNSEMTWLPVLAGAAGAMGTSYCSPYIAVDGAYHARPPGQTSALTSVSSKESNTHKSTNEWKPAERPELANDDFGQRQKNPRRYTEMKFDQ